MVNPLIPQSAVVRDVLHENADTSTFTMQFTDEQKKGEFAFRPGQFNMLSMFGVGEAPISISSDGCSPDTFTHTIRHVGSLTKMFSSLKAGDLIGIRGPYGKGWPMDKAKGKDVLIVAGGIGLAPLCPAIYEILRNRGDFGNVELLYGAKNPGEMLFTRYFDDWSKEFTVHLTVDDASDHADWAHHTGVVTKLFDVMNSAAQDTVVMTCGPEIMMKYVAGGLQQRGFDPSQIFVSLERKMHCGIKKCGRCQIGTSFVCQDGPVFPYSAVANQPAKIVGALGRK